MPVAARAVWMDETENDSEDAGGDGPEIGGGCGFSWGIPFFGGVFHHREESTVESSGMSWKQILTTTNILGVLIGVAGILRLVYGGDEDGRFGETTLLYFLAAAAVFLLARAKTFKYGELELELREAKMAADEAATIANIAADASAPAGVRVMADDFPRGEVPDDPWKGVFGGKSLDPRAGRALSAVVTPLKSVEGWYSIVLAVRAVGQAAPLEGKVRFFLHDTFRNDRPEIQARNGVAQLHVKGWGAFTVGAVCDDGKTKLELDLAELATAPIEFRMR